MEAGFKKIYLSKERNHFNVASLEKVAQKSNFVLTARATPASRLLG
jgi:hypothetical protein